MRGAYREEITAWSAVNYTDNVRHSILTQQFGKCSQGPRILPAEREEYGGEHGDSAPGPVTAGHHPNFMALPLAGFGRSAGLSIPFCGGGSAKPLRMPPTMPRPLCITSSWNPRGKNGAGPSLCLAAGDTDLALLPARRQPRAPLSFRKMCHGPRSRCRARCARAS